MKYIRILENFSNILPVKNNETYQLLENGNLRSKKGYIDIYNIVKSGNAGSMEPDILIDVICELNKTSSKYILYTDYQADCLLESWEYYLVKHPDRIKELGEVFTPTELVLEILDQLPPEVWEDGKTYLDPTCGNGQFLAAVAIIKRELGHKCYLKTIYGVDIMEDNVDECRQRLLDIAGDTPENKKIVENNIRCEDGLKYDYSFRPIDDKMEQYRKALENNTPAKTKSKKKEKEKPVDLSTIGVFGKIE